MKIALIGATGGVGREVLAEALRRAHEVVALCRHPERLDHHPGLQPRAVDVLLPGALQAALEGCDLALSCYSVGHAPGATANVYKDTLEGVVRIVQAMAASRCPRLIFVGGAASLYLADGRQLLDLPGYPHSVMQRMPPAFHHWLAGLPAMPDLGPSGPDYVPAFVRARMFFSGDTPFDWSFFSPPPAMVPGLRTGTYTTGGATVPMAGEHFAGISYADAAVALLDEAERPARSRQHWTAWAP